MSQKPSATTDQRPAFQQTQYHFTAHLRDPDNIPAPDDVPQERIDTYRELFIGVIDDVLATYFPVLHEISEQAYWDNLVSDFMREYQAHNPLYPEIAAEFINYLETVRDNPADPPYLYELAHYEWVETALFNAEEPEASAAIDPHGDLLQGPPVLSELAVPLAYQFDVHHISHEYQPDSPPDSPTHLLVYRDDKDEVGFIEINAVTLRLIQIIAEQTGQNGLQMLQQIASELNHPQPDVVIQAGKEILEDLRAKRIILGIHK